jgi:hypothetical protein
MAPMGRGFGWLFLGMCLAVTTVASHGDMAPGARQMLTIAPRQHDPVKIHHRRSEQQWDSTNWSGYAVTGPTGSVTDVKGSWTVPSISGACPAASQYSSFWVGIDGFSDNSVEQIGTDSDCQNGQAVYYAWFEFYPHPSFIINSVPVQAGDTIHAEVKSVGRNQYTVSITDITTGHAFSTTTKVNAQRSSAEWIAEAPSGSGGILPLADFGTVFFDASSATVGATTAVIGSKSFANNLQEITMVSQKDGTTIKAAPSAVVAGSANFSDTWYNAGP